MKRLFAAIKIQPTDRFISLFGEIASSLRHERIKWVEPENMHLTLKFFGQTDEKRIPAILKALKMAVGESQVFNIKISDTGIFGSRYDPRVVWFGIEKQPMLDKLAHTVITELEKCGWERDRQNFVPHLTIGRIKELKDVPLFQQIINKYKKLEIQEGSVSEIILYESILRREGPLYIKEAVFELGK